MTRRSAVLPAVAASIAFALVLIPSAVSARGPAVTIDYRKSSCIQLPMKGTG